MRAVSRILLLALHIWVVALYYGALAYSYSRLYPQMKAFLGNPERYEAFAITVAAGLRWWVLGALAVIGGTGAMLVADRWNDPMSATWNVVMAIKAALLIGMIILYVFASWVMWPRRLFASPEQAPAFQTRFDVIAWTLGLSMVAAMVLSAVAHRW